MGSRGLWFVDSISMNFHKVTVFIFPHKFGHFLEKKKQKNFSIFSIFFGDLFTKND